MRILFIFLTLVLLKCTNDAQTLIPTNKDTSSKEIKISKNYSIIADIPTPQGFERLEYDSNSFGYFLRHLKLNPDNTVYYFNGTPKPYQNLHFAVLNIDIGNKDLQQCADAVMRLRAEYLFSQKKYGKIHFNFLNDNKPHYYTQYVGNDRTYERFRKYMDYIFSFANTQSLYNETFSVTIENMQIGDFFIQVGNPYGHAMIVVDMAENKQTGEKICMLAQSYMPAQSIHIVNNFKAQSLSPWYKIDKTGDIYTPQWTFSPDNLHRFLDK